MEIFKENGAIANLFTKFAISMAQFLLPFLITFVAARDMSFRTLYFLAAGIIIVDGIFLAILPFPPKEEAPKAADGTVEKEKNEADTLRNFAGLHRLHRIHNLHAVHELQSGAGQALWHDKSLHDSVLLFRGHHLRSPSDSGTDEKRV